jgi:hypothetical protein
MMLFLPVLACSGGPQLFQVRLAQAPKDLDRNPTFDRGLGQ